MTTAPATSWTAPEIETVRRLAGRGWSTRNIARHLNRSVGSVTKLRETIRRQDAAARRSGSHVHVHVHTRATTYTGPRAVGTIWVTPSGIKAVQTADGPMPFFAVLHASLEALSHSARPRTSPLLPAG